MFNFNEARYQKVINDALALLPEVEAAADQISQQGYSNVFFIVDEAQNLTPLEIKTILTRAGDGSKIVLTGDPYQIDTPYLDDSSNGLVHAATKLRGQKIVCHIVLTKGERSELASLAAEML